MEKNPEPAFPGAVNTAAPPGMSLRDYFAAQALANPILCTGDAREWELQAWFGDRAGLTKQEIASAQAYSYADSLLKRRSK